MHGSAHAPTSATTLVMSVRTSGRKEFGRGCKTSKTGSLLRRSETQPELDFPTKEESNPTS
jgi:hypothetical protein